MDADNLMLATECIEQLLDNAIRRCAVTGGRADVFPEHLRAVLG